MLLFVAALLQGMQSCAPKQSYVVSSTNANLNISNDFGSVESDILQMIDPYKSSLDKQMDEEIGHLTAGMEKGKPSSTLINFMGEAMMGGSTQMYQAKKLDAALMNYGGVRLNSVPAGIITVRLIYELMPFDNTLVVSTMTSAQLQRLLDRIADSGGWPLSKNISFELVEGRAVNATIDGQAVSSKDSWVIGLPNYIAEGGDNCGFLAEASNEDTGLLIRDLLIAYVKNKKEIVPDTEPRIIIKDDNK